MGNKCGGMREPCLSDTDPRFDEDSDFSINGQTDIFNRASGLYRYEGTIYHANGTVQPTTTIDINETLSFPVDTTNFFNFLNYTVDGTRAYLSYVNLYGPAFPFTPGWVQASSTYSTSTFELDGRLMTSPSQFVGLGNGTWRPGEWSPTYVVSDDSTFGVAKFNVDGEDIIVTLLTSCIDKDCDKTTQVRQIYRNETLDGFEVTRGTRFSDATEFYSNLESKMEEFRVPEEVKPTTFVLGSPYMPPDEELWCETDPSCAVNPYVEPTTAIRTGPLIGFIVLGVVFVGALIYFAMMHDRKMQKNRYRTMFARRIAQTITIRASPEQLTSDLLQKEFERIDQNGNGYIEKDDLWNFLNTGKVGRIAASDFEALWSVVDTDNSGKVYFLEFCAFMGQCHDEYNTARKRSSVIATRASFAVLASAKLGSTAFTVDDKEGGDESRAL